MGDRVPCFTTWLKVLRFTLEWTVNRLMQLDCGMPYFAFDTTIILDSSPFTAVDWFNLAFSHTILYFLDASSIAQSIRCLQSLEEAKVWPLGCP